MANDSLIKELKEYFSQNDFKTETGKRIVLHVIKDHLRIIQSNEDTLYYRLKR